MSKARTLDYLKDKVTLFSIPEFLFFEVQDFAESRNQIVNEIKDRFQNSFLIIRSSAADEDGHQFAMAGEYDSVLNVSSADDVELCRAIDTVIGSYQREGRIATNDEFIVQEMLLETSMSGVVFTHDLNSGAPYYVINYDDVSGLTDTVTSGGGEYSNRTLYIHRGATESVRSIRFQKLLAAIHELEKVMDSQLLDIEFALDSDFVPYLLQARAITTHPNWNPAIGTRIDAALEGIQDFVAERLKPIPGVYGDSTVLGQMPDWNPAEMIGRAPRALAFSLYKSLITDHAWRIARAKMGYATPGGQPLMVSLAGQPFIDTRLSFHSFLPREIPDEIGNKLVNAWISRLRERPELHDKVEFEVAITTFSFDFDDRAAGLSDAGLSDEEISIFRELSRSQTSRLLADSDEGGVSHALAQVNRLAEKQENYHKSCEGYGIAGLFEMIDDCIQFGTVPFSILARHGFIAQTILKSLGRAGILSMTEVQAIQSGIRTVASDLVEDMRRMQQGEISRSSVMAKYGHLRPGTYDILSQRYDQMPDFGTAGPDSHPEPLRKSIELDADKIGRIDALLESEGIGNLSANDLMAYIQAATAGREFGKFVFTRSLSQMLELIAEYGDLHGLSRQQMSHIPIDRLIDAITKSGESSIASRLLKISENEAEKHELCVAIRLPQILFDEAGVHVVPFQVSRPNFITSKNITAPCVYLKVQQTPERFDGKIVLIENADPGFDWIFSQNIGGLITKYGGANSHMAIRCAEFGIPAAIGCGEQRFDLLVKADRISLDCSAGLINILH